MGWLLWSLETFPLLWPVLVYVAKIQAELSTSVLVAKALETRSSRGCPSLLIPGVLTPWVVSWDLDFREFRNILRAFLVLGTLRMLRLGEEECRRTIASSSTFVTFRDASNLNLICISRQCPMPCLTILWMSQFLCHFLAWTSWSTLELCSSSELRVLRSGHGA